MTASLPLEATGLSPLKRAALFAAVYFVCAEASRFLSVRESTYVSFWLPAGLYVAVLLLNERRVWPALAAAAFAANAAFDLVHGTPVAAALLFSLANAVQSVASAWLVTRFIAARPTLSTLREFAGLLGYAAVLGNAIGATIGAATLLAFDFTESFVQSWKVWWGSNAMAILMLSPFILTWFAVPEEPETRVDRPPRLLEGALLVLLQVALTWHLLAAGGGIMAPDKGRMVLPLLWAGLRFGPRGAAAANLLLALPIAFFTTHYHAGLTPAQIASGEYVFIMQITLAIAALIALLPAIVLAERERTQKELQRSFARLQELTRRVVEAEEAERRNISRELHDRVGQNLSALNLSLNLVRAQLPADTAAKISERLGDAQTLVESSVRQVRDVMADLRPPALDDYGLLAALRTHADALSGRLGVPVTVTGLEPEPRLSPATETALFRIAQEALNNVSKHAHAANVEVRLSARNGTAELSVTDDGVGFDPAPAPRRASWGLTTMRERAEAVGATLRIERAPAGGTRVTVQVKREA